jgi:preprotein translocase subunit YajC
MTTQPIMMSMVQAAPASGAGGTAGLLMGLAPWLLIFVIFYLLMIRPQQRRVKEHQAAIAAVKKVEVEIAQGVKVRVVKSTISAVVNPNAKPAND